MQERIHYIDIKNLGFKEIDGDCQQYFNEFGFDYVIITKKLTKTISLDWSKESQLCEMIRIDNKREQNIVRRIPIMNLKQLTEIIDFFTGTKEN